MGVSTNAILAYGWADTEEDTAAIINEETVPYKVLEECENKFGVTVGVHCSDSCPMLYLADAKTLKRAYRGYPKELSLEDLIAFTNPEGADDKRLRDAIEFLNEHNPDECSRIKAPKSFGWFLVSYWG